MERLALTAVLMFLALLLGLLAVGFLAAALYLGLATLLSPPLAALASAGVLLVAALLAVLVAGFRRNASRATGTVPASDLSEAAAALGSRLGEQAARQAQAHPWAAAGAALACGAIVGANPRLRALLMGLLRG